MDILYAVLVAPFVDMASFPAFFVEVVLGGLMTGVMYSLVALGFVLIFKASGVFNFSQGVMVLFAALTLVGLMEHGAPVWLALILTVMVMIALAYAVEWIMLRHMSSFSSRSNRSGARRSGACPTACKSGSSWAAPWRRNPTCCFSTSPWPA